MNREEAIPFLSTARAGEIGILEFCGCKTETLWIWNLRAGGGIRTNSERGKVKGHPCPSLSCLLLNTQRLGLCVWSREEAGRRPLLPCSLHSETHSETWGAGERNSLVLREGVDEGLNSRDGSEPRTLEDGRSSPSLE